MPLSSPKGQDVRRSIVALPLGCNDHVGKQWQHRNLVHVRSIASGEMVPPSGPTLSHPHQVRLTSSCAPQDKVKGTSTSIVHSPPRSKNKRSKDTHSVGSLATADSLYLLALDNLSFQDCTDEGRFPKFGGRRQRSTKHRNNQEVSRIMGFDSQPERWNIPLLSPVGAMGDYLTGKDSTSFISNPCRIRVPPPAAPPRNELITVHPSASVSESFQLNTISGCLSSYFCKSFLIIS